ncbi:MAG TPA: component of SufBCD complex [Rhodobacteraceae bacterium]|nr:component of SufBCD complex [Paracoccaceae bacterium]
MDWYTSIFELIDMRSFSNLWYWIVLAVVWSTASHWVLGVPYDMITRARRNGGQAEDDLQAMVRINVNRLLYIARVSGVWLTGFTFFLLSGLIVLGFVFSVEFAQAVFLIALPMSMVAWLSVATAVRIENEAPEGAALRKRLLRHRLYTKMIGTLAIFVTAVWGMYVNMTAGVLGG